MTQTREQLIEVMARAMLADEMSVKPRSDFSTVWADEMPIWLSNARAALAALEAAGVRLVPVEIAQASWMAAAGLDASGPLNHGSSLSEVQAFWAAMLAASPYAPKEPT